MSAGALDVAPRFRALLAGLDAEGLSDSAVEMALRCEEKLSARLWALHVSEHPGQVPLEAIHNAAVQHLRLILRRRGEDGRRAESLVLVRQGKAGQCLLEEARACEADILFLGPHRHRGWLDFGSTARTVLAHAPRGVWLQPGPVRPITSILCPVDLSPDSLHALRAAVIVARAFGARVTALHLFQSSAYFLSTWPEYPDLTAALSLDDLRKAAEQDFQQCMQRFEWDATPHSLQFEEGEPAQGILRHSSNHDLVVLGSHGRTGLSGALLGNTAYSVMKRSDKPVFALRHPERTYALG